MSLALDEPKGTDKVIDQNDVTYIIAEDLAQKAGSVTIDFVDMGWQSGFSITSENPVNDGAPGGGCGTCSC